jgi:sugar porter (SP) family MFS transporter
MLQQLAIVTGILISFISNYLIVNSKLSFLNDDNYWRYMLAAAVIPSLVFFILLLMVPESPRWLVTQGKLGPAERIFEKIFHSPDLAQAQVQAIRVDLQSSGQAAPLREVLSPRYRRTVLIGLAFAAVAQLTGINIVFYYAPLIFEKTRMGGSVLYQTLLTGIVNLVFTIVAFWLIDRLGRKKLLLMGSWIMGLCMLVLGSLFLAGRLGNYLVLGCIFVYIGGFACSWGAVLWVYVAEIFPNRIRGTATSIAVFGNWVANSIVSFTFPLLLSGIGPAATFFIYAFINLGMLFFVHRYVFETKGVALEKIEELYATV